MEGRTTKTRRNVLRAGASLAACCALAGCGQGGAGTEDTPAETTANKTTETPERDYESVEHDPYGWDKYEPDWTAPATVPTELAVETLVTDLEIPWDLSFAATGDLFVTERTGRLLQYQDGRIEAITSPDDAISAGSVEPGSDESSWWVEGGEGGTMGVAAHPNYPEAPLLFVYYTAETSDGELVNRLASIDVSAETPADTTESLLEAPADTVHNGGRIAFGPANYLWVCVGDSGEKTLAADPTSLAGSILRVTPAGEPAPNNPIHAADGDPRIYSLGHRNPQGVDWLPDASPVVVEHGPGPDEVNLVGAGGDHGWPAARQPDDYATSDYRPPVASTALEETWAPSGCVFYTGDAVPSLRNRLLIGCLASEELRIVTLTPPGGEIPPLGETGVRHDAEWLDDRFVATTHARLTGALGRIRHVEQGPSGELYAIVSNRDGRASAGFPTDQDDRLVRLRPA